MLRFLLTCVFFLCLSLPYCWTQGTDLTQDKAYFESQREAYQEWLNRSGFGDHLQVHDLSVEPDELALYLKMPYEDVDSIMNAWKSLKVGFERSSIFKLEEQLFYKMIHLMDIDQTEGNIQLYNTYDLAEEPVFFRGIYFDQDSVAVAENNPRSKIREMVFDREDFAGQGADGRFSAKKQAAEVFDLIYNHAARKYQNRNCPDRAPTIERLHESERLLRFEVYNLCQEVITGQGFLCPLLKKMGLKCNFAKRELLRFTISYIETPTGFQLQLILDGKFGSALFQNARRSGYISMEEDFDEELERYADLFIQEIREKIKGP